MKYSVSYVTPDSMYMVFCLDFCCLGITGFYLAAGFTDGSVHIMDAVTLEDETKEPFKYARGSIINICFSHDSRYLATAVSINKATFLPSYIESMVMGTCH